MLRSQFRRRHTRFGRQEFRLAVLVQDFRETGGQIFPRPVEGELLLTLIYQK
jgi:hypothetical protein